jgi:D-beta-D-heptose 7-phosphate kinase/D-beta-D-heptose 1-phosphate adenosyltransferase
LNTIVLVTGGFDPLHSGHIEYFKAAKALGFVLIVGLNSDAWLTRKKGQPFMNFVERKTIIENLYQVHKVIEFNDDDGTAIDAIKKVKLLYPRNRIVFANGGDRTQDNIPEMVFDDVEFVFGVGGKDKKNSSTKILNTWIEHAG